MSNARFALGRVDITHGVIAALGEAHESVCSALLARHVTGDWGNDPFAVDHRTNDEALLGGGRLFSSYEFGAFRVWVITEADRSKTTLLLPDKLPVPRMFRHSRPREVSIFRD